MSTESARHESFERQVKGTAGGATPLRVLGTRPWLFMVGQSTLEFQGYLGPSPAWETFCGRPRPRGPGRQGSSTAHCTGFCATKAHPPRRGPPEGSTESAELTRRYRGARQARAAATTICPRAARVMRLPHSVQRAMAGMGCLARGNPTLPHPQRHRAPRDGRVLKHDTEFMLKIDGKGPAITSTSTVPLRAQNIRLNIKVGRVITSQPEPQGNMSATESRHQAKQFTSHTV